jgi:transportin-1
MIWAMKMVSIIIRKWSLIDFFDRFEAFNAFSLLIWKSPANLAFSCCKSLFCLDWLDDEEFSGRWNLRKCSAASLDTLATIYRAEILPFLLPLLQQTLSSRDNWLLRESGVLALGAVAEGCYEGIKQFLPQLIPHILDLLRDSKPLVRSISCWTLSRYSKWVMQEPDDNKYFRPLMIELLQKVLDKNKKVQEAACSAFATLEEEAGARLVPYLNPILHSLIHAFGKYQAKNRLILYDAIGTLAEAVGTELNKKEFVQVLMPPLISKWNDLQDNDRSILPLLECLTSLAQALELGFSPFAGMVFGRCIQIIDSTLTQQRRYNGAIERDSSNPLNVDPADTEFVVCAIDLLSGLCEGLGTSIQPFLHHQHSAKLLQLLYESASDVDPDVRQSAFALLGDLAKSCVAFIAPALNTFIPLAAKNLNPAFTAVCNNASWSLGEIAIKVGQQGMKPYMEVLLAYLARILVNSTLSPGLLENTAITIGRLASVCPAEVSEYSDQIAFQWCIYLARIRDNGEKTAAFLGLCLVAQKNPRSFLSCFVAFCSALNSYQASDEEIHKRIHVLLNAYKTTLGQQWTACFSQVEQAVRDRLAQNYKL